MGREGAREGGDGDGVVVPNAAGSSYQEQRARPGYNGHMNYVLWRDLRGR